MQFFFILTISKILRGNLVKTVRCYVSEKVNFLLMIVMRHFIFCNNNPTISSVRPKAKLYVATSHLTTRRYKLK